MQGDSFIKYIEKITLGAGLQSQTKPLTIILHAMELQGEPKSVILPFHTIALPKNKGRQDKFDATIRILLNKFPNRGQSLVDERNWRRAERYLRQVLVLLQEYCDSQNEHSPLSSSQSLLNLICDALW